MSSSTDLQAAAGKRGSRWKPNEGDAVAELLRVTEAVTRHSVMQILPAGISACRTLRCETEYRWDFAETDAGAREVEDAIMRIVHGVFFRCRWFGGWFGRNSPTSSMGKAAGSPAAAGTRAGTGLYTPRRTCRSAFLKSMFIWRPRCETRCRYSRPLQIAIPDNVGVTHVTAARLAELLTEQESAGCMSDGRRRLDRPR